MNAQPSREPVGTAAVRTQWEATAAGVTKVSSLTPHRQNALVGASFLLYIIIVRLSSV